MAFKEIEELEIQKSAYILGPFVPGCLDVSTENDIRSENACGPGLYRLYYPTDLPKTEVPTCLTTFIFFSNVFFTVGECLQLI